MRKILVVDDERAIVDILRFNLQKDGYEVIEAYDGEEGLKKAFDENPDLILLDVMLPLLDGFSVCKKVRDKLDTPIIMLTAKEEEIDKVLGLELGADDYITKPFSIRELLARVKANMRRVFAEQSDERSAPAEDETLTIDELKFNFARFELCKSGKPVVLTMREFEALKFLATHMDRIYPREALLEKVWGYEYYGDARTVDVTIRRLREKIEDDPSNPRYIMTKRGIGYYFADVAPPTV